ncbi:MAG: magnesium chelatase domain-containing protein, partial [Tannerellaceae bacterium]
MLVKSYAAAVQGVDATLITIEVSCSQGLKFFMVGLPDMSVKESHERMISAIQQCGLKFPKRQIVINMAPADIKKEGAAYDLPLAISVLAASDLVKS